MRLVLAFFAMLFAVGPIAAANAQPHQAPPPMPANFQAKVDDIRKTVVVDPRRALRELSSFDAQIDRFSDPQARRVGRATILWLSGECYSRLNDFDRARSLIDQAMQIANGIGGTSKLRGGIILSRGGLQANSGKSAEALESYHDAYREFVETNDLRGQALALQDIAALYGSANDYQRAEKYYREAADRYQSNGLLAVSLRNNLGSVLLQLENYKKAEDEYSVALRYARQVASPELESYVLGNLARVSLEAGNAEKAQAYLKQAFKAADGATNPELRNKLLAAQARTYFVEGRLQDARRVVDRIFADRSRTDTQEDLYYIEYVAYEVYAAVGDDAKALVHLAAAKRLNDDATKVASNTNSALAAANFDFQNQELKIAHLKADGLKRDIDFQRSEARFERVLFVSIGGAAMLLVIVLSVSLVTIRRSRDKVRKANIELGQTNLALEEALAAKTRFLATTSHEIRTPLNGILGMTQVMLANRSLEEAVRERVSVIHGAGLTMRALVDDILDVAKMETGRLTIERRPMDLHAALNEVARIWEDQARARGLGFALDLGDTPQWIEADSGRIRQIVFNLLANALKFTETGHVDLTASRCPIDGEERLRIAVSDTGIGIPEDKREEIFESFKQVDSGTTRKFGGTGLGLAICSNLADALGGDIRVESEFGAGSTFYVTLPLIRVEQAEPAEESGGCCDGGALLVVEANPISRSVLKSLLAQRAGTLRFVSSAAEARDSLPGGEVGCLLIDQGSLETDDCDDAMPALREIAKAAKREGATLLLMWKAPDEETVAALREAGADHVIAKPIAGSALAERIFGNGQTKGVAPPLVSRAA